MARKVTLLMSAALVLGVCGARVRAQNYPDTMWIPVTFYDYHSDKSNPEFEADHQGALRLKMVADQLDAEGKPQLGPAPYMNYYIKYWFRPWDNPTAIHEKGDLTIPVYTVTGGSGSNATIRYDGTVDTTYDTAFINKVIRDSLPFIHLGRNDPAQVGMYQFSRTGDNQPQFFWLDGKSGTFGNEGQSHNFSFTMELHSTFTYAPGLTFNFNGDDDVWVFVNKRLAMDLGGIHSSQPGSFNVDAIAQSFGLQEGVDYSFDFFYAERHTTQSTILVTTNILAPPKKLRLYPTNNVSQSAYPSTLDWKAGDPLPIYAHVLDSNGVWAPGLDSLVKWAIVDTSGNSGIPSSASGSYVSLSPTEAYGTITITATYTDPQWGTVTQTQMVLRVVPGAASHVNIIPDSTISDLRNDEAFESLTLSERQDSVQVYAIVRDKYGNYVRTATNAAWDSRDNAMVKSVRLADKWRAILVKTGEGDVWVVASEPGLGADSLRVTSVLPGTGLVGAIARDADGNGYLDHLELHFDSLVTLPPGTDFSQIKVTRGGHDFAVTSISGRNGATDSVFVLALTEWHSDSLQTSWTPRTTGRIANNVKPWTDFLATDGAGPVAQSALHLPGWVGQGDTILVILSEEVGCAELTALTPSAAFRYYRDGAANQAVLDGAGWATECTAGQYVSSVRILVAATNQVYPYRDSIQLVDGARDRARNAPPGPDVARKAAIKSGGNNRVEAISNPNPFTPGVSNIRVELPAATAAFYDNVIGNQPIGTLVAITVQKPLSVDSRGAYGSASIYDAVGNLVRDGLLVKQAADYRDYGVVWDGRNTNGRMVGSGGYLMTITGTDADGNAVLKRMKVGVKR